MIRTVKQFEEMIDGDRFSYISDREFDISLIPALEEIGYIFLLMVNPMKIQTIQYIVWRIDNMRNDWVKFKEERFQKYLNEYKPKLLIVDYPAGKDNQLLSMRGMTVNELIKHIQDSVPVDLRDIVVFDRENDFWRESYSKGGSSSGTRHQFMQLQIESDTPTEEYINHCQERAERDTVDALRKISQKRIDEKKRLKEIEHLEERLKKLKGKK